MTYEFDRYINGQLMAEGVTIERQTTLEGALRAAARIASRGKNGEVPVLVLRAPSPSPAPVVVEALEPFAWIGQWLFARGLPDDTTMVTIEGAGKPFNLTRGMFKAAHTALASKSAEGGGGLDANPRDTSPVASQNSPSVIHKDTPANPAQVVTSRPEFAQLPEFWQGYIEGLVEENKTLSDHIAAIGAGGQAVADTWFTDRALPVRAMSGDAEDTRVLRLHFRRPVTDDDRKAMCDALNLHQASLAQPPQPAERVVEDERVRREMEEILSKQSERDIPFAPASAQEGRNG